MVIAAEIARCDTEIARLEEALRYGTELTPAPAPVSRLLEETVAFYQIEPTAIRKRSAIWRSAICTIPP
jgi:hypothetical protein